MLTGFLSVIYQNIKHIDYVIPCIINCMVEIRVAFPKICQYQSSVSAKYQTLAILVYGALYLIVSIMRDLYLFGE